MLVRAESYCVRRHMRYSYIALIPDFRAWFSYSFCRIPTFVLYFEVQGGFSLGQGCVRRVLYILSHFGVVISLRFVLAVTELP